MIRATIENAKAIRELAALTAEQLGVKSGTSARSIWFLEAGTPVKLSTARKIAKALGVPFDQIKIIEK